MFIRKVMLVVGGTAALGFSTGHIISNIQQQSKPYGSITHFIHHKLASRPEHVECNAKSKRIVTTKEGLELVVCGSICETCSNIMPLTWYIFDEQCDDEELLTRDVKCWVLQNDLLISKLKLKSRSSSLTDYKDYFRV